MDNKVLWISRRNMTRRQHEALKRPEVTRVEKNRVKEVLEKDADKYNIIAVDGSDALPPNRRFRRSLSG